MKNSELRVLQLIDSLDAGGAERVSINMANALSEIGIVSFITQLIHHKSILLLRNQ